MTDATNIIKDVRHVLPLAVCHAAADVGDCVLPEGGSSGWTIEDVPTILRAATIAWEAGPPGDPAPPWDNPETVFEDRTNVLHATRSVVAAWISWCHGMEQDMEREQSHPRDPAPPEAPSYWREQAEAAERVLSWLDALDREVAAA